MATNEQILVKTIMSQEKQERAPEMRDDDYFGLFATQLIMNKYDLSDAEIEDGNTDGGNDGGCDGIFLFVNDDLIHTDDSGFDGKYKKGAQVTLHLVQAKNTGGFSEDPIMKWKTLSTNLLNLETEFSAFHGRYSDIVLEKLDMFRTVYVSLIRKVPKLSIVFHYASLATEIHPNVQAQADELSATVKTLFPTAAVSVDFVTAGRILELYNSHEECEKLLRCRGIMNASEAQEYVALVSLSEYYKFITDDNGHLIRHIFESNVRDYQGNVAVNKQIEATLESVDTQEDFWWLNNGVTILAKSVQQQTGNHLLISEPEIVNGLQSSSEVHAYFSRDLSRLDSEARCILLRVIVPQTEESRDHVILATNSQTAIPKSSLRASDVIHRQIEIFFKGKGLFYDRRKNYYKNQGKPIDKIISIPFLAQCLISTLLAQPDYARARPSTLLEKDVTYKKLFNNRTSLPSYYNVAYIGKYVSNIIKHEVKYSVSEKTNIQFATLLYYVACLVQNTHITASAIEQIDLDMLKRDEVIRCADATLAVFCSLGGTDKVAKNREFTEALLSAINQELSNA